MGTDITYFQMLGVELMGRLRHVFLVVSDAGVTDDKRVDTQVKFAGLLIVLRRQRVEHKLIVGCSQRVIFIKVRVRTKQLG